MKTPSPAQAGVDSEERALAGLVDDASSRKRFLSMVGAGGAAAFATLVSACGERDAPVGSTQSTADDGTVAEFGPGDIGIVNYALTLEYLEEDFYDQIRKSGEVTSRALRRLIDEVYANEQEHARALELVAEQMGRPVRRPKVDFESVLEGGEPKILSESAKIENLGASAYLGQAPRVSDKMVLASALSIHTVEARHAAAFNKMAGNGFSGDDALIGSIPDGAFAKPKTMKEVVAEAQKFLPDGLPTLDPPGE